MLPVSPRLACLARILCISILFSLLGSCVSLDKRDAFPVAGKPLSLSALQTVSDRDSTVRPLKVFAGGRPVAAYYVGHPGARGVLIFFGGSGNQVDAPIQVIGKRAAALGLDFVSFSYYQQGEPVPSVTEARAKAKAVYDAVKKMDGPSSKSIYLLGHSLGGWFALDVAASANVDGLALVGAETTPGEVIRKTYSPWADLVAIRPDDDAKQLDASLYASSIRTPTLVVTSNLDEAVPATVGRELFAMLPAATPKHLVVLDGVLHGRYFLSDEFWRQFALFFHLPEPKA